MKMYRNYDGNKSTFGDTSILTVVPNPDNLSAFGAVRTGDGALTLMVINKNLTNATPITANLTGGLFAGLEWDFAGAVSARRKSGEGNRIAGPRAAAILSRGQSALPQKRRGQTAGMGRALARSRQAGELIELQRSPAFKNDVPRVIRPDILLTETGFSITELDSVPGGIGLTAWLNQTYSN
jgi:hypothetical protein